MPNNKYNFRAIEAKWQKEWEAAGLYRVSNKKEGAENYYVLVEYPYPSGNLHIGHWYAFAVPDIFARKKRMEGYNVLFPIGFDSFGLPAENAAIKHGLDPKEWTYANIARMTEQFRSMGNAFDWSRVVAASDPEYYRWTQWLFLALYKKGLAYKARASVNWCPSCKTVLANEQVIRGRCERCDSEVTAKELEQWFLKITEYADRLLADLDDLEWPEEIKESQRNWIGKSEGAEIEFSLKTKTASLGSVRVFTTRSDTLFGATFLVLGPEHEWLVQEIRNPKSEIRNKTEVENYIASIKKRSREERMMKGEKTGVDIKGITAINPATGEEIPVWVADYVLGDVGTGAIMAVPAHDERDFQFAKKYNLPIKIVVCPHYPEKTCPVLDHAFAGSGHLVDSGTFDGIPSEEAKKKITEFVRGTPMVRYRLRDWSVSRQRYWGVPIPIVYDREGNAHPVPQEHLPWRLPKDVDFMPTGEPPLARSRELKERTERIFGKGWRAEPETLDTFVDSSWYFLRYLDPTNEHEFASRDAQDAWMPVNRYSGGAEHTTLHLLYSRFFYKALYDLGLVTGKEPYRVRMNRGVVLGPDGQKMSKSRGNVIDPDDYVRNAGADAVKMYLAFLGPYNETGTYPWDLRGILGTFRFLERVWKLYVATDQGIGADAADDDLDRLMHKTIKKVGEDIESFKFNTAVSALMILFGAMEKRADRVSYANRELFLKLLAPFAPHLTEELWYETMKKDTSIHSEEWPNYDPKRAHEDVFMLVIQVNGKVRDTVEVLRGITEDEAKEIALQREKVKAYLKGNVPSKIIFIPGRLLNIVI